MVGAYVKASAPSFQKIQRADTKYTLQEIASSIQTDLDKRLSYDEALMLGNMIRTEPTRFGDSIVYAISDRDAYRRTLELYLRDAFDCTEQPAVENAGARYFGCRTRCPLVNW